MCAIVCCSVLKCVECVAVYCSVLQCVAVCCSVLQCVAVCYSLIAFGVSSHLNLQHILCIHPPKNGEIALLLTTNSLMCSKKVSQKRNEAIDNCQWYNMLDNFIS